MLVDITVDLQYGDCGKGKVTHHLCRSKDYTHVLRYNGGCNAGHTIYHNGKKYVTHHIPAGVFFGVKSIIGSGCVVNKQQFFKELQELRDGGINPDGLVFIAKNAHVITESHMSEDGTDTQIGTTKRGNGPAYRDKYSRDGLRAEEVPEFEPYLIDLYEEFHGNEKVKILGEGAQGFGLDIDWGDYPYVTSSHCTSAGALLNAIPPAWVQDVWGVAKIYETYVGAKSFEPPEAIFQHIRDLGEEYGATTGRPRQCNWMDFDLLNKACKINGVNKLVFNKMDILREVGVWKLFNDGELIEFKEENEMKDWIRSNFSRERVEIFFSEDKNKI
jgi:adenylosuccinate synthase|tara:strand:+ start:2280 stop:3269 length:990 start_codon:yes stop_codon:yes gene_type:complete